MCLLPGLFLVPSPLTCNGAQTSARCCRLMSIRRSVFLRTKPSRSIAVWSNSHSLWIALVHYRKPNGKPHPRVHINAAFHLACFGDAFPGSLSQILQLLNAHSVRRPAENRSKGRVPQQTRASRAATTTCLLRPQQTRWLPFQQTPVSARQLSGKSSGIALASTACLLPGSSSNTSPCFWRFLRRKLFSGSFARCRQPRE